MDFGPHPFGLLTLSLFSTVSTNSNEKHLTHPNSPSLSVGIIAARLMELEPENDCWQRITHDWYTQVVAEFSRHGKLHHHLGLLSREAEGEELRGVYHLSRGERW